MIIRNHWWVIEELCKTKKKSFIVLHRKERKKKKSIRRRRKRKKTLPNSVEIYFFFSLFSVIAIENWVHRKLIQAFLYFIRQREAGVNWDFILHLPILFLSWNFTKSYIHTASKKKKVRFFFRLFRYCIIFHSYGNFFLFCGCKKEKKKTFFFCIFEQKQTATIQTQCSCKRWWWWW